MKPIPTEMRKRILDDLNSGMTWTATAQKWKISLSFIAKLKRQVRDTNSIEPIKPKTGPKPKLKPHYTLLQKIVEEKPDATLVENVSRFKTVVDTIRKVQNAGKVPPVYVIFTTAKTKATVNPAFQKHWDEFCDR